MTTILILSATAFAITAMLSIAASRAWAGWLALRRLELERIRDPEAEDNAAKDIGVRIELAAVRERLKKLEAIASGVEL